MLVVFSLIFVAKIIIIFRYDFVASSFKTRFALINRVEKWKGNTYK